MSGGSFDYVHFKVIDSQVLSALPDIRAAEEALRTYGKHDAADEVLRYIREVETHQRRLEVIGERIAPLLKAIEWTVSGDTGISYVDKEYFKLMGMEPPGGET